MRVLVTGASGFVGHALWNKLSHTTDLSVIGTVRVAAAANPLLVPVGELAAHSDWSPVLRGIEVVIHAAARVHVMNERAVNPLTEYRRVNVQGTLRLAQQAAVAGARRFIFISSIKINGEATETGQLFCADDAPKPADAYGISKMEAEKGLREIAAQTGMEVVIIRPPLVYGPGVKANFESMMRWLARGLPLPLASATENRRSLVALENLVDLIVRCIEHPAAANQTFMVSDGEDLSTADLLRRLGSALGHPARLVAVPIPLVTFGAGLVGKRGVAQRLCGSLQVDIRKNKLLLNWEPPVTVNTGLRLAAERFLCEADL